MSIVLKRIGIESEKTVQQILEGAPKFHLIVEGCIPEKHFARRELTELPPNTGKEQKLNFLAYDGESPVAFIDLIDGYPTTDVAFLGLLLLPESVQRAGYGRQVYDAIEQYIRDILRKSRIRLGVAVENPVEGFWLKMGFAFTGESRTYKAEKKAMAVRLMEKALMADSSSDLRQYNSWSFGDSPELADQLLELVLAGKKTATSGPLAMHEIDRTDVPKVGQRSVVLDSAGKPRCLIETTEVKILPFNKVDSDFAAAEGEGDLSLEYWRTEHKAFSKRHVEFSEEMLFVCERFKLLKKLD